MATLTIATPAALAVADGGSDLLQTGVNEIIINAPAALVIADPGNAALGTNLEIAVTATLKLTSQFELTYTYSDGSLDTTNAIVIAFEGTASIQVGSPNFALGDVEELDLRLMPGVFVSMPTPIIVNGHPIVPKYLGQYASSMPLNIGSSHIHVIADPNPVWNPSIDGWYYPPPASGIGDARWTVDDLPDPSTFPGQYYWLGTPSPYDGTSSIAAGCRQWPANGSTPGAPAWQSVYPYKPSVWAHVNYGANGKLLTFTRGVRFNLQFIECMWSTWPTTEDDAFTWIFVGIIMNFPTPNYIHTIMDVGGNPASYGAGTRNVNQLATPVGLPTERALVSPSRPWLGVYPNEVRAFADTTATKQILTPFNAATRPKMFFGVYDRGGSSVGNYSTAGKYVNRGTLTATQQKYILIGREGGQLDRNKASHLVLFEMRFFHSAMSAADLEDQYNQLSSAWKFSEYS